MNSRGLIQSFRVKRSIGIVVAAGLLMTIGASCSRSEMGGAPSGESYQATFTVNKANLVSRGDNAYFPLLPGHRLTLTHGDQTLVVTVLDETKMVDGVQTRVVEERETEGEELVEISRNYFAIDRTTGDVYYFGEDVDIYRDGRVSSHDGAWLSGVNGATFGLMMPGKPARGQRYYQEHAPGIAMDRAHIVSLTDAIVTPAGEFKGCLKADESSAIESGTSRKVYAPGIGMIKDDDLVLVSHSMP